MKKHNLPYKNKTEKEEETIYFLLNDNLYTIAELIQGTNMSISDTKEYTAQLIEAGYLISTEVKTKSDEICQIIEIGGKTVEKILNRKDS